MTELLAPRSRKVKILATLGPASSDPKMIRKLMLAGADAFRINMSHGDQKQKAKLVEHIRALEKEFQPADDDPVRPSGAQAPRRPFRGRAHRPREGRALHPRPRRKAPATSSASQLPHAELFEAVRPGTSILIDDGKVRLNVLEADDGQIVSEVKVGGHGFRQQGRQRPRRASCRSRR